MPLGQRIKELRERAKMSQEQLGQYFPTPKEPSGISKQAISHWENDRNQPTASQVVIMADLFGVSADELLGLSGSEDKTPSVTEIAELVVLFGTLSQSERSQVFDFMRTFPARASSRVAPARNK